MFYGNYATLHLIIKHGAGFESSFITSKPNKMNSEQIIKSDVLDILFENRNKMYGAYNLRKFYSNRMYKALGVMLATVAVFATFAFMSPHKTKATVDIPDKGLTTLTATIKETPPAEQPKPQPKQQRVPQIQFTNNIAIVRSKPDADTIRNLTPTLAIGTTHVAPVPGDPGILVGSTPGPGDGPATTPSTPEPEPVINPEVPIDNPDVEPQFPGGMQRLRTYLQNNLTNPRDMEEGEKVRVVIKFVVGYDGKLKAFETIQDGGDEFNKEVMRVLKRMPAWTPGKAKGQNVSVYFTLPVVFTPAE